METKEYRTIDRASLGWPSGVWDSEPDKVQWPDEVTGFPCLAVRNSRRGNWCGYVGVNSSHPLFEKEYSGCDLNVHGGLTFADKCYPRDTEAEGICHVPGEGEPHDIWWFGFDCAHSWDHSPEDVRRSSEGYPWTLDIRSQYRTLAYVKNECAKLAEQLAGIK